MTKKEIKDLARELLVGMNQTPLQPFMIDKFDEVYNNVKQW